MKEQVRAHLKNLNWQGIVNDVRPFVEPGFDLNLLTLANLEWLLAT
ncbi:MAG: hypothetical protein ACYC3P_06095 [Bellilinea sp.]